MSETVLKFFLSELKVVRIHCKGPTCGAIIETDVAKLGAFFAKGVCPVCGAVVQPPGNPNLEKLAQAIDGLSRQTDRLEVEFVLPEKA